MLVLGYDKVIWSPDQEEKRLLFSLFTPFLEGYTPYTKRLTDDGIPPGRQMVGPLSILTNEKYKGDALLQKRYTRTSQKRKLTGEVPQYYVEIAIPHHLAEFRHGAVLR